MMILVALPLAAAKASRALMVSTPCPGADSLMSLMASAVACWTFFSPFRLENSLAALPLSLHLLLHGFLNIPRRYDILQLHPVDLDTPGGGILIQQGPHFGIDMVST